MYLERNKSVPTEENITNFNLIFRACLMKNKLSDLLYNNFKQNTCYRMFSSIWKILREEEKDKWAKRGEKSVKISVYPLDKLARCRKLVSVEPIAEGDENPSRAVLEKRRFCLWEIRWVYLLVRRDVWCKRCWQTREYVNVSLSVWSKSVIVRKFMVRFDVVPLQIIITRITFINNHVGNIYNWINCRNKYKSIFDKCK